MFYIFPSYFALCSFSQYGLPFLPALLEAESFGWMSETPALVLFWIEAGLSVLTHTWEHGLVLSQLPVPSWGLWCGGGGKVGSPKWAGLWYNYCLVIGGWSVFVSLGTFSPPTDMFLLLMLFWETGFKKCIIYKCLVISVILSSVCEV